MKKDLQTIIKAAAARYGLKYNEEQTQPTIRRPDGTVDVISKENFYKAFGITYPKMQEKWSEIPGEAAVTWQDTTKIDFDLNEDMHFYKYSDKKIVA